MPQRILKPGITTSPKWDGSSWMAQSFYIRLLTLVDDFGRYEANINLLRSHAFPLREDMRAPQVQKLCHELQANQLAIFYKVDGKEYLQLTNWTNAPRAEKSKFPAYDNNCKQIHADANTCKQMLPLPEPLHKPLPEPLLDGFEEFWKAYPRKNGKGDALKIWSKLKPSKELAAKMIATLSWQKESSDWTKENGKFIPHPSTWLNKGRWDDEPGENTLLDPRYQKTQTGGF